MSLCISCGQFYGNEATQGLCSLCFLRHSDPEAFNQIQQKRAAWTNKEVYLERFRVFCLENHPRHKFLGEGHRPLQSLKNLTAGKDPGEVCAILHGFRDSEFGAVALTADQALELLTSCVATSTLASNKHWGYIHAILPLVIDFWEIDPQKAPKSVRSVTECYYTTQYSYVDKDSSIMIGAWKSCFGGHVVDRSNEFVMETCAICLDDVMNVGEWTRCGDCDKHFHQGCCARLETCPNCRASWV